MSESIRDLVIVGGGPAGLSAAIYAQRSLLDAVTLEQEAFGGQVILTSEVDNYPGLPHTDGFTLTDAMKSQAEDLGAEVRMDQVKGIVRNEDGTFEVTTAETTYVTRSVIVAGGATPRHAGFAGEETYGGRGVSYCATCDGMFYRGKEVFVVGGGNSACEEALFLTRFASKVTLVVRKDHLCAQYAIVQELEENPKVEIRYQTTIEAIGGGDLPSQVTFRDSETGETHTEDFDEGGFGVFVFVGRVPATSLVEGLVELDGSGYAITDERMATDTPGLFCAGDLRQKSLRQIITAAADGAIAATSAAEYLGHPISS